MNQSLPKIIAIVGPTASGKTTLAKFIAEQFNGELISADSRQVYRGLDIGTGKDGVLSLNATGSRLKAIYPQLRYLDAIPQWLVDIAEPTERYTVADWQRDATVVVEDILQRGKLPIIVGGTGLYVSALLDSYDFPADRRRSQTNPRHSAGDSNKKKQPNWQVLTLGLEWPRPTLYQKIDRRLDERMETGLIAEAMKLHRSGISLERFRQIGLEYRYLADFLDGQLSEQEMIIQLKTAIHRLARRQLTWWRHHGQVQWVVSQDEALATVTDFLNPSQQ